MPSDPSEDSSKSASEASSKSGGKSVGGSGATNPVMAAMSAGLEWVKKDRKKKRGGGGGITGYTGPSSIPGSFHRGGKVRKSGKARVKKGEVVLTAKQAQRMKAQRMKARGKKRE